MTRIAIIGAGLSGRLVALNLLRRAPPATRILMIDRSDAGSMGPAYSGPDYLLLNVPADRMGAFPEDPEHFLKWANARGVPAGRWDFLPRTLYREYVFELLHEAQRDRTGDVPFEHVRGEVTDIETTRSGVTIHVASGETWVADKAVLALGNFPPRHPPVRNRTALESRRYVRNPWEPDALDGLARRDTVVLIGTGQTMVDLAITLQKREHAGRIVAISRRGLLPLAHRGFESYPSFYGEIKDSKRMLDIFRTVRKHFERAEASGIDKRAVIDSLRPDTQALWLGLPADAKRRFFRHLFRYWEAIRSRLPPESKAAVEAMRASGRLEIVAGRIRDLVDTGSAMEVRYSPPGRAEEEVVRAARVVSCIGPETHCERVDHPLVTRLLSRGLIRPGPASLGLDALPNGAIIDRDGAPSKVLYTLGSTMRGVLWEVLAVPDIRVQAEQLARLLAGRS